MWQIVDYRESYISINSRNGTIDSSYHHRSNYGSAIDNREVVVAVAS